MVANTVFINAGLDEAIQLSDAETAAELEGSPLNNLLARVHGSNDTRGGNGDDIAEFGGRQCYRAWTSGRSPEEYHANVKGMGHGSVYEHSSIVFQITGVSRALTHELIRHRVGTAYSQESQRYVDAKDMNFVVPPLLVNAIAHGLDYAPAELSDFDPRKLLELCNRKLGEDTLDALDLFRFTCQRAIDGYRDMQPMLQRLAQRVERETLKGDEKAATSAKKRANEAARSLLPNASETRLLFTINLRQMHHVLTLRGAEGADLEIRRMVVALLDNSRSYAPHFFRDVRLVLGDDGIEALRSEVTKL
jgi:thymidylate synthase (FAD)